MAHFNNEAEFAGVLGHEIGHIAARHSANQYSQSMLAQLGLTVGVMVSKDFRKFADLAQTGVALLFLKFGRDDERQSDKLGVEYSTKIGYDAKEMAGFFNTLDKMRGEGGSVPTFLSTHPDPQNRSERVRQLAEKWQAELPDNEFETNRNSYLRMIDGIIYGNDPRQGYAEGNVFYHPVMKFQYPIPQGWAVQNTPEQVQMAPQSGDALMILTLAQEKTLDAAANAVVQNYGLGGVDLKKIDVNGMPGVALMATQSQDNTKLKVLAYLIQDSDRIYNFLGVAEAANFNSYSGTFSRIMQDFRKLSDPSKINKQPTRLRIKEARNSGTLREILLNHGTQESDLQELAVLNGMELNESVEAGTLIKVSEK